MFRMKIDPAFSSNCGTGPVAFIEKNMTKSASAKRYSFSDCGKLVARLAVAIR